MKILLTGGTGMVGHNIKDYAYKFNAEVFTPSSKELNLLDEGTTRAYINHLKPDFIIHTAGLVGGIQANMKDHLNFMTKNLDMGRNLILAAKDFGVKNFINLASSCMYPRNAPNPLKEEYILQGELEPTNEGYAIAKIFSTRLCEYINRADNSYRYKTVIPCNLYGKYDKFGAENAHMLPDIMRKIHHAKLNNKDVEIWGDGEARREYLYAEDVADFMVYAVKNFDKMPQNINLGVGFDQTVNEYYQAVSDVVGYKGKFVHNLDRPVGMLKKLMDDTRTKAFGWKHKHSLHEGIERTYKYYLENVYGK